MEKNILETRNLSKKFGNQLVVNNISLQVKENCIYGLLGPNGAGKSTTLKMITGKDLEQIGALIELPPLYENLSARENLKVRTMLLGLPESRIDEVLKIVGLSNTGKKRSGKFSLGMKQRLGIAIALLNNPKLLILDEPTNGLDPLGIQELREMILGFPKQGITVILSSHNISEVEQVADYIGIICEGELKYQDIKNSQESLENLFLEVVKKEN